MTRTANQRGVNENENTVVPRTAYMTVPIRRGIAAHLTPFFHDTPQSPSEPTASLKLTTARAERVRFV